MKPEKKKATIKRYNELLEKYGYNPKAIGWPKDRQLIRFKVQSEIGDFNKCSILDVGCGFGDLYRFLMKRGLNIKYTGYDINPNLIKIARKVYPNAHFEVKDIEVDTINDKFDWVFSVGVFNSKAFVNKFFIKSMIRKMFELCDKGVAIDFISTYVDFRNEKINYVKPEEIFSFCKTLSRRVLLRHDYMPFEFCIYIYKNDRINERDVFTEFEGK